MRFSHTWGADELTFEDWIYVQKQNPPRWGWVFDQGEVNTIVAKSGYQKLHNACRQARNDGRAWIWADTVCINKTSSAELSDAINSMYQYYRDAKICYAFLGDVDSTDAAQCAKIGSQFRGSRWFTRGWTLQELLVPEDVHFYSKSWALICSRSEVASTIEEITTIPRSILGLGYTRNFCTNAEIMSWAASRTTTREEDMAYCLMGLFDVNMPLLYGEGDKAFLRLQLEIAQTSPELTLLMWQGSSSERQDPNTQVLQRRDFHVSHLPAFASHPRRFSCTTVYKSQYAKYIFRSHCRTDDPCTYNGRYLILRLRLIDTLSPQMKFAVLPFDQHVRSLWIPVQEVSDQEYVRVDFPSCTISISTPELVGSPSRTEIRMPVREILTEEPRELNSLAMPVPAIDMHQDASLLMTFPAGLGDYRASAQFPRNDLAIGTAAQTLFALYMDKDLSGIAFGAIEFSSKIEERDVAVFFAVEIAYGHHPKIVRWTCKDISQDPGDAGMFQSSLEMRARSQLRQLRDPSLDHMAPGAGNTWDRSTDLKGNRGAYYYGVVLLDDRVYNVVNYKFGHQCVGQRKQDSESAQYQHVCIVTQIVFPRQERPLQEVLP